MWLVPERSQVISAALNLMECHRGKARKAPSVYVFFRLLNTLKFSQIIDYYWQSWHDTFVGITVRWVSTVRIVSFFMNYEIRYFGYSLLFIFFWRPLLGLYSSGLKTPPRVSISSAQRARICPRIFLYSGLVVRFSSWSGSVFRSCRNS